MGAQGAQGATGPTGVTGPTGAPITQVAALGVNTAAGPTGEVRATGIITAFYSDERLKDVISSIDSSLDRLDKINGVYYEQSDLAYRLGFQSREREIGVIAQQVQKVLPEVIKNAPFDTNKHGHSISGENYLTVKYEKIIPLLVEALKEQKEQIDYIKSKL